MTHEDCDTCQEYATHALLHAKVTNAPEVSTGVHGGCVATAVIWTDEDYAEVWK